MQLEGMYCSNTYYPQKIHE